LELQKELSALVVPRDRIKHSENKVATGKKTKEASQQLKRLRVVAAGCFHLLMLHNLGSSCTSSKLARANAISYSSTVYSAIRAARSLSILNDDRPRGARASGGAIDFASLSI
jgi:hypothetical protein